MTATVGRVALELSLALLAYAAVAGAVAASQGRRRLHESAVNALAGAFVAALLAAALLVHAFHANDFSLAYVADHSSRELPRRYAFTAIWGGQAGSLLLWLVVLTGSSFAAVALNRDLVRRTLPWTVPALGAVGSFFALVLVVVSSPFATHRAPIDGAGLTPSLQNAYMAIHPPMLYLGYVGLTIPFAFGIAALASGRFDERWIVATRRWTLVAWTLLGLGMLLGARWAYEEIGWGGYYAWDPVENAALMPWLASTAFLHSVMVQERKNMLRVWNAVLVTLAFCLALFGTFLTRSGVVQSVHSFSRSSIGPWFLGFIVVATVTSTALILWRLPHLRTPIRLESTTSREAAFLYNNLLLVALALTVLWGVVFPMLSQLVRGQTMTIGRPYYDFFLRAFGLPLLLLMGIGPLVAWRRTGARALRRAVAVPSVAAIATGAALVVAGAGSSRAGLIAYSFSAFVLAAIGVEFVRGARAAGSVLTLVARNRRRYGGYVVHASVVLLALGIAGSNAYASSRERSLQPGETVAVGPYALTYLTTTQRRTANATELRAHLELWRGRHRVGMLAAGKNRYDAEQATSNEVAIRTDWLRADDVYVIADEFHRDGSVYVKVLVHPLVALVWLSGGVFLLGSAVALWPDARERRRVTANARVALAR